MTSHSCVWSMFLINYSEFKIIWHIVIKFPQSLLNQNKYSWSVEFETLLYPDFPQELPGIADIKVYGYTSNFSPHVFRGKQFSGISVCLFDDEVFAKWDLLLKERISPVGANSFLHEMTPIHMGGNNEMTELLPLKVLPFTLCAVFYPSIVRPPKQSPPSHYKCRTATGL